MPTASLIPREIHISEEEKWALNPSSVLLFTVKTIKAMWENEWIGGVSKEMTFGLNLPGTVKDKCRVSIVEETGYDQS